MIIGICDDEIIAIKEAHTIIKEYLDQHQIKGTILEYNNVKDMIETTPLDVLFLDIDINGDNGIDAARRVHEEWPHCQIVFLTQYVGYVSDVYDTEHVFFVLKDRFPEYVDHLFKIILHNLRESQTKIYFTLPHDNIVGLYPSDIIYVERNARKSVIHTYKKEYEVDDKISQLYERMTGHDFIRCHNSFIVSLSAITEVHQDYLILLESIHVPISRRYKKSFKDAFLLYSANQLP